MSSATLLNTNDPTYAFEHMMQHREYFAVMGSRTQGLSGFSALPYILDPAHDTAHPAWAWNKNHQQAHDDYGGDLPSNSNNGVSVITVFPPTVTGTGNATLVPPATTTTTLVISNLSHSIIVGSSIVGAGIPDGTVITAQQTGPTGGNGTYTISQPVVALTNVALTIDHPPYEQATAIADAGTFGIHQAGILIEGDGQTSENREWWTFANHTQHLIANDILLPLPTTSPTSAGTGPGTVEDVSDPWWWEALEVIFPFW